MLQKKSTPPESPYMALYDLVVPKNHLLRRMKELVDFSFIYDELKSKYSDDQGRPAICPIRMFKYLVLKAYSKLSDVDLVERAQVDMAFKYFLDMAPEEKAVDSTSLTTFRRLRLQDVLLLDMLLQKTVEIAIEQGVMKSGILIADATHTASRYQKKSPKEYLAEKARLVRKTVYQFNESMKKAFPAKATSQDIEEEIRYCERLVETIEDHPGLLQMPAVREKVNVLKEAVDDCREQLHYSADTDARTGYKSKDHSFFGYKTHLIMSDERIITAAAVTSGEKSDGPYLKELVEKSRRAGVNVEAVVGDTAYSGKENLLYAQEEGKEFHLVAPLHPVITRGGHRPINQGFVFNKDADTYACPADHLAVEKKIKPRKAGSSENAQLKYFFDVEICKVCPLKEGCYKEGAKTKIFAISLKSEEHAKQEAFQESDAFKELYKVRYKIEAKNSEIKNRHGHQKAHSTGLFGMQIQASATLFTVNMKRIIKLIDEKGKEK